LSGSTLPAKSTPLLRKTSSKRKYPRDLEQELADVAQHIKHLLEYEQDSEG
jgi:hypothetical protein